MILISGILLNPAFSQVRFQVNSLFIGILSNGDSIVQYDLRLNTKTDQITLPLIGGNINDILIRNYLSKHLNYTFNSVTNEIRINSQNESQIRVSYQTPDLVNKQEREWSFSIKSDFPFTVKLPNDAVVTNLGEQSPSLIRKLGGQNLLSFDKGKISIEYVIGYAGTREQAIISINSADLDLAKAANEHIGINLDQPKSVLHNAKKALNQSNFIEAERLANNASDSSAILTEAFEMSKIMLSNATSKIKSVQNKNIDTTQASEFISKSNIEFTQGNYPKALEYATLAINSLNTLKHDQLPLFSSLTPFLLSIPIAGSIAFYIILRHKRKTHQELQASIADDHPAITESSPKSFEENNFVHKNSSINEQKNDDGSKQWNLHEEVQEIIKHKSHLKPEEKEILFYLSDKEGVAFEGEIRNKFIMPKTSLWRLIKRLERENLIVVTKIGGQNMIKLKIQK